MKEIKLERFDNCVRCPGRTGVKCCSGKYMASVDPDAVRKLAVAVLKNALRAKVAARNFPLSNTFPFWIEQAFGGRLPVGEAADAWYAWADITKKERNQVLAELERKLNGEGE
jgi:hypothetical protein